MRLGRAVNESVLDALNLPDDVRLAFVEVEIVPTESEQLAATKAENEHQHVSRVERVPVPLCGLEELSGLVDGSRSA